MPGAKHLIPDHSAISSATKEPYLLHISPGAAMLQTGWLGRLEIDDCPRYFYIIDKSKTPGGGSLDIV